MNVLLIEDDPLVGEGIQVGLQLKGMTVDWLQTGEKGASALTHPAFDAMVLDLWRIVAALCPRTAFRTGYTAGARASRAMPSPCTPTTCVESLAAISSRP